MYPKIEVIGFQKNEVVGLQNQGVGVWGFQKSRVVWVSTSRYLDFAFAVGFTSRSIHETPDFLSPGVRSTEKSPKCGSGCLPLLFRVVVWHFGSDLKCSQKFVFSVFDRK